MAQRSRKRGRRQPPPAPSGTAAATKARRPTSEERNEAVRASLVPLSPGERPWPVNVSVALALALGLANLVLFLAGAKPKVGGQHPHLAEILIFSGLMVMCAIGMWMMRYWALLGFQTLLAIGVVGFCLALIRVQSAVWAVVCVAVIGAGGFLFFKLVRVLSRVQMPAPPGR